MSNQSYQPSHIANFFLKKAEKEGIGITQMKLLKLVYIGYGWVLAISGRKLFDDPIEAWQHGPVISSLYNEFKHFGKMPIAEMATEFDLDDLTLTTPDIDKSDKDAIIILGKVWDVYKNVGAWALRNKTHETGTPWTVTYSDGAGSGKRIPENLIEAHFKEKIEKYLSVAA